MEFKHFKVGETYFKRVGNTYTEFTINDVMYEDGCILHNGDYIDINDVYIREENGQFKQATPLHVYITTQRNNVYINDDGEVKCGNAKLFTMPLTDNRKEDFNNATWSVYDAKGDFLCSSVISTSKIFTSYSHAKESTNIIVNKLDGTKEEIKGLIELVQLDEDQINLVNEFKNILKKMEDMDIVKIGYDVTSELYFYNGRHVNVYSGEADSDEEMFGVYDASHVSEHSVSLDSYYVNDDPYYRVYFNRK